MCPHETNIALQWIYCILLKKMNRLTGGALLFQQISSVLFELFHYCYKTHILCVTLCTSKLKLSRLLMESPWSLKIIFEWLLLIELEQNGAFIKSKTYSMIEICYFDSLILYYAEGFWLWNMNQFIYSFLDIIAQHQSYRYTDMKGLHRITL